MALNGFICWWKDQMKAKLNGLRPPAFPSLPLLGSLPFIRNWDNVPECFLRTTNRLGPIFTLKVGHKNILVLNNRELIEEAYVGHSNTFSGRSEIYIEAITNPSRKGIVTKTTSPEWKRIHQLSLSILKEFGFGIKSLMEERILTEVNEMTGYLRKKNGQSLYAKDFIEMISTNIINNIIFGHRFEYEQGVGELFVQMQHFIQGIDFSFDIIPQVRFLPRYQRKLNLIKESLVSIRNIIKNEIERCKMPEADDCFVRRYFEREGSVCDEEQLIFTVKDLLGAGSDTTMLTLLWSLVALGNHPAVQDRMRAEIDGIVSRQTLPRMDDQRRLPFVEATILETLRWKTLVPLSLPRETLADVRLNGYFIPAGTMVLANLYAAHMDPKVWTNPIEFQPERFLDNDNSVIGKSRIVPFSLGRRSCLGEVLARAELFLILSSLVQNFIIRPPDGNDRLEVEPLKPIGFLLTPSQFVIQLIPRM